MSVGSSRILIIDDEPKLSEVVKAYLEHDGHTVAQAHDCHQAELYLQERPCDLLILDLMLPDMSGEDFCRKVRAVSDLPILMLTAKAEEANLLEGLRIGADDYMSKPFSPRELAARVAALLRRSVRDDRPPLSTPRQEPEGLAIDRVRHEVTRDGMPISLTPIEYKLFDTLFSHPGRAFTREALITAAMGQEYDGYDRTIDSHIKNLRQKIEEDARNPVHIRTLHGIGYRFDFAPKQTGRRSEAPKARETR